MKLIIYAALIISLTSCGHSFLDIKKESTMAIPNSVEDFIGLMDNSLLMNFSTATQLTTIGADEFVVPDGQLFSLTVPQDRNAYIWADDVYENQSVLDWDNSYQRILYCNMTIEGLEKFSAESNSKDWRNGMGMALFFRALNFYFLQQEFGQVFEKQTANKDLGIPLRLKSDVTLPSKRASVLETYNQIIKDLNDALPLLPERPLVKRRPSKQAVHALLARVHLTLENYEEALTNANLCIELGGQLIDYALLETLSTAPFPTDEEQNSEIILFANMTPSTILRTRYTISPELLEQYQDIDYRKDLYFQENLDGRILFNGTYTGISGSNFTGLALDEVYLIKIECLFRLGNWEEGDSNFKYYLEKRYGSQNLIDYPTQREDLLAFVLLERRRQLVFRGIRWIDLRRLNKDPRFQKTLIRHIDGQTYTLEPKSNKYTWPIPDNVIEYGGLEQNPR